MKTLTVPLSALSQVHQALECFEGLKESFEYRLEDLAKARSMPDSMIGKLLSPEAIEKASIKEKLNLVNTGIESCKAFLKIADEDFITIDKVNSVISSNQPYNVGSRENY